MCHPPAPHTDAIIHHIHHNAHLLQVLKELGLGRARVPQQEHVDVPTDAMLCLFIVIVIVIVLSNGVGLVLLMSPRMRCCAFVGVGLVF